MTEAEQAGTGMDVGQLEILSLEKLDGITYDASSGEALDEERVKKVRASEMETFKNHGVYTKAPVEECWRVTGEKPIGVKRVDVNK